MTTLPSGQIMPAEPGFKGPNIQRVEGSPLEAASKITLDSNAKLAETAKAMGAGQKGAARRRRKTKKRRGGAAPNLNAQVPSLPEAGTISGVSHADVHVAAINNLNQIRYDKSGDALANAQPYDPHKVGGKRTKHGRRNNRTHRRRNRRSTHSRRRSRRSVL